MKVFFLCFGLILIGILTNSVAFAQVKQIRGTVSEHVNHSPLAGANVYFNDVKKGTVSDKNGYFIIDIPETSPDLIISFLGYKSIIIPASEYYLSAEMNILMEENLIAFNDEVVIVGSHFGNRTSHNSQVPVDRFPSTVLEQTGQTDLSQQINSLSPSFYSTRLTYSDATDHMDPAALRGLNPDQTLILVNGKRHHPSAVVNTLGVVGRGSVINDLNTIPASAISRVEILRNGASAQYGSDAIAGVINIILKSDTSSIQIKSGMGQYYAGDGFERNISANFGFSTRNKGYINITTALNQRNATNRAGIYEGLVYREELQDGLSLAENLLIDDSIISSRGLQRQDFNLHLGNSKLSNANVYLNAVMPLSEKIDFYTFGGLNYRYSISAGDYRLPNDFSRNDTSIYPNGFLPQIDARLEDQFISTGIRGLINKWNFDLSNTFGSNSIGFFVNNSLNASMGSDSPVSFESGGIGFRQNTLNLDINQQFYNIPLLESISLAFGSEFRVENYQIKAGEAESWINENQLAYPGAQGYPGYQPVDEVNKSRSNAGIYADAAFNFTKAFLIESAVRYENYSDFGNNVSGKLSTRYSIAPWLNLRGSLSTGFRAPSLQQSFYSYTGSYYYFGSLFEVLTASNESRVTEAFGIPKLKQEGSVSSSIGFSAKSNHHTTLTIDAYQVDVKDRIVLSSTFWSFDSKVSPFLKDLPNVGGAQFFTNAINTRTRGIDVVITQQINLSKSHIDISLAGNLNKTEVIGKIHSSSLLNSNGLDNLLFDNQSKAFVELSMPRSKIAGIINYSNKRFAATLRNVYYGQISYRGIDNSLGEIAKNQDYSPKVLTDLKIDIHLSKSLTINIGCNNIFDVYPDKNVNALQHSGRFPYNTAVSQFGFNGGYYYGGLVLDL